MWKVILWKLKAIKLALKYFLVQERQEINQGSLNQVNTCFKGKRVRVHVEASWHVVKNAETAEVWINVFHNKSIFDHQLSRTIFCKKCKIP